MSNRKGGELAWQFSKYTMSEPHVLKTIVGDDRPFAWEFF